MKLLFFTVILGITLNSTVAQSSDGLTRENLVEIHHYVGLSDSTISQRFGSPDEVGYDEGKNAVVWTYITKVKGETAGSNPIAGYHQFAFWNGIVAGYRTRRFSDEEQAVAIYNSTLAYMGEDGRTIASVGNADPSIFTDSLRVSRRDDNLWNVDVLRDSLNSHALIWVGDIGYRGCRLLVQSESKRIEKQFGIRVTEEGDTEVQ